MTETDAGAFDRPLVAGIDALRKLVVRHARARQRRAGALQGRAERHAALSRRKLARSSVTWRVISFSISSAHKWTALATPFASALPWLLRTTPLRPRNTAPLWLFGSRWWRSNSVAGREIRKTICERVADAEERRSRSVKTRADPPDGLLGDLHAN